MVIGTNRPGFYETRRSGTRNIGHVAGRLAVAFGVHRFVAALLLNLWFLIALALASGFHHAAQNAGYVVAGHITSYTWAQVLAWAGGRRCGSR